ncbi:hypothetical protein ASC77_09375 [Nocardioides sp. Root1257]|uniref:DUF4307 domain-containing protein n=1 Tax=unclassified Nocardioides TaxID=2615069 RepID=UPI0006F290AC|nr:MULTISPECIES: DUF4307 domain-containing protein [unclassified Nocardioides]KQW48920.1 hypothetical protein ASC77_09375 [Nocardioides sp. Root1257]KRC48095.1 hypothetical protein ASE24_09380 [Nocardioides sp. Root224]
MTQPTDLADRYGAPAPWRRRTLVAACVVVVAAFLGWLGWTIWDQSTPHVRSDLVGFDIVDEHRATATIEVRLRDGVAASCTLRAYAEDHTVVGELVFAPTDGRSDQDVRTERRASSVELLGCTAPGQNRPR